MVRMLKVILVMALAAILVMGLTTTACCDGGNPDGNGDIPNGNVPNGNEPNGSVPGEPDLISGPGFIIDCDEYGGSGFQGGDPAPDFRFQDAEGQTFSLSDFRGKSVMLNFWRTTCGYCKAVLSHIEPIYDEWQERGVVILTLNIGENHDTVADFMQDNGFSFPVLLDRAAEAAAQYRVSSIPRTFFIDRDGLIQGIKFGAFQSTEELEDILNQLASQ